MPVDAERGRDPTQRPAARPFVLDGGVAGSRIGAPFGDADEHAAAERLQRARGAIGERAAAEHDLALRPAETPALAAGQHDSDELGHARIVHTMTAVERLILFAKTPELHQVKTRLAHEPHTRAGPWPSTKRCWKTRSGSCGRFETGTRDGELCVGEESQGDGDLGARMHRALLRAFAGRARRAAAIIGTDAPSLPARHGGGGVHASGTRCRRGDRPGGRRRLRARRRVARPVPALFDGRAVGNAPKFSQTTRRLAQRGRLDAGRDRAVAGRGRRVRSSEAGGGPRGRSRARTGDPCIHAGLRL